jgi:hypothetical protein
MSVGSIGEGLKGATAIAASGLRAATLRLDVAAHNLANLNTDGFVPARVVDTEARTGGVHSTVEISQRQGGEESADGSSPEPQGGSQAGAEGGFPPATPLVEAFPPSGTNPVAEVMNILMAEAAFTASLRVLTTHNALQDKLLEALG